MFGEVLECSTLVYSHGETLRTVWDMANVFGQEMSQANMRPDLHGAVVTPRHCNAYSVCLFLLQETNFHKSAK